jgi:quinol monooxygenase YgiN
MHLRINDVGVPTSEVDELAEVLSNKALPVVVAEPGCLGMLYAADRRTGDCAIVSMWDSRESLDQSERAIASIRSAVLSAVTGTLYRLIIADVLREVRTADTTVGSYSRVVRLHTRPGNAAALDEFYAEEAIPRLSEQAGFLNGRLVRDVQNDGAFIAVSHWTGPTALDASEANSKALRDRVAEAVPGTMIDKVTTSEILLFERT